MPGGATSCAAVDFPGSDLACGESQERSLAKGMRGGYTCCVPGCYNNNKKDKEVSFHKFLVKTHFFVLFIAKTTAIYLLEHNWSSFVLA